MRKWYWFKITDIKIYEFSTFKIRIHVMKSLLVKMINLNLLLHKLFCETAEKNFGYREIEFLKSETEMRVYQIRLSCCCDFDLGLLVIENSN
jgi:hypothetical protein